MPTHVGFAKLSLFTKDGEAPAVEHFIRNLPLGAISSEVDLQPEFGERIGGDAALVGKLSKLVKAAQAAPTAARAVGSALNNPDGLGNRMQCTVTIGEAVTILEFGSLDFSRDPSTEVNMRISALEGFRSQLSQMLALAAENPTMQIGSNLIFVSDRG